MSGLVKGVKKVFKAIGNAVKKIIKSPIFKALLIGAAAIFTGGAAMAAFGAMGSTATLGSVLGAAASGGMGAIGSAVGAVQGMLGLGTAATAAPIVEGGAAAASAGAGAVEAGTAGLVGEMGVEAGSVAAGAMPEAAAAAGGMGTEIGSVANGVMTPEVGNLAGGANTSLANIASPGSAPSANGWMQNVGTGGVKAADITGGMLQGNITGTAAPISGVSSTAISPSSPLTSLWDFVKNDNASKLLIGQTLAGIGQGVMSGRAAEAERNFRQQMSAVPDMTSSFQLKPGFNWALKGSN